MIGQLTGQLLTKKPPYLLLDVHGVGYDIETSMTSLYQLPACQQSITLHTHLWVREDAMRLYGFVSSQERDLFRCLLKVNGIGCKVALAILSNLDQQQLVRSVQSQDLAVLVKVPGIGKKTAQRLLIDLRDALKHWTAPLPSQPSTPSATQEAISALVALGYKTQDAERTVARVGAEHETCEDIIRYALKEGVSA